MFESEKFNVNEYGDSLQVDLWYPEVDEKGVSKTEIAVGLTHVRAADDIYIRYDFQRDGWSISQQPTVEQDGFREEAGGPVEVAFLEAWALEKEQ